MRAVNSGSTPGGGMKRGRGTGPAGLRSPTGTSTTEGTRAARGTDRGHIASRTGQDMWGTITRTRNMDRAPSTTQMALNMKVQDPLCQSCVRRQHPCPSGDFRDPEPQKQTPGCLLGSWVEDLRRGHGVYTYPNGDTYDGEWLHHVRHGPGTYHYSDTGAVYRGCWVNDQMESAGGYVYSNHRYEGNFVNNAPGGPGKYVFDTGCEQHGEYRQAEQRRRWARWRPPQPSGGFPRASRGRRRGPQVRKSKAIHLRERRADL
uniref:Uncharacterized protein n=1 Tax=Gasterosteus aculeatus aculeatus TaxID=481459 RepID=A0AAQ4QLR5_GASAC